MPTKTLFAAVVAIATLGLAAASDAAPTQRGDTVSVRVPLADLNLGAEAGAQVALRRIRNAATTVCGERPAPMLLAQDARYRACLRTAVDHAVASLGAPMVTSLNERHGLRANVLAASR